MTYQPHTWTKGETITAQLLQNMDNGVAAAIDALESAFGSNYTMGSKEYKVDFTKLGEKNRSISAGAIEGTTIKGTTLTATDTESASALDIAGASELKGNVTIGTTDTTVDTTINGKLVVTGKDDNSSPAVHEAAALTGTVSITGDAAVTGDIAVTGNIAVTGDTTLTGNVEVNEGDTTLKGKLLVKNSSSITDIWSTLNVRGKAYYMSDFYHNKAQTQTSGGITIEHPSKVFDAYYQTINLGSQGRILYAPSGETISDLTDYSSTINLSGHILTISNTTTDIQSSKTKIEGNVIIGPESNDTTYTNTVIINANSTLNGITTIDKLIVGDSTATVDNKIYGFTTISDLVVGAKNAEAGEAQTYSGTATFNTQQNFLHGNTTIDNLTVGTKILHSDTTNPDLSSQTAQGDLKITSRNIIIGLQSTNEYPIINANSNLTIYGETSMVGATEIQNLEYLNVTDNSSNNVIAGSTTITNLTVPSLVVRDRTTTNGGYSFTISDGTNLRLSQNNNNHLDFYFANSGELIFSGAGIGIAKSDAPNGYVILTAAQLEQIKSYCNITDGGDTP